MVLAYVRLYPAHASWEMGDGAVHGLLVCRGCGMCGCSRCSHINQEYAGCVWEYKLSGGALLAPHR
eukprot:scaffold7567_cov104-Isochrysis_galbana.AAC.1